MAKISVKWSRFGDKVDLSPALIRYTRYLERSRSEEEYN